ncbi:hypothetical protein [Microbacterium sp. 22296]
MSALRLTLVGVCGVHESRGANLVASVVEVTGLVPVVVVRADPSGHRERT